MWAIVVPTAVNPTMERFRHVFSVITAARNGLI